LLPPGMHLGEKSPKDLKMEKLEAGGKRTGSCRFSPGGGKKGVNVTEGKEQRCYQREVPKKKEKNSSPVQDGFQV